MQLTIEHGHAKVLRLVLVAAPDTNVTSPREASSRFFSSSKTQGHSL